MNVVMIGTGNVAHVLGRLIIASGHTIVEVVGRNEQHVKALAQLLQASPCSYLPAINPHADMYIIAVSDSAVESVAKQFNVKGIVVHTAASVTQQILRNTSSHWGVLYPLQSLRSDRSEIPPVPFLVDGNSAETIRIITGFAKNLSESVQYADDDKRLKTHIAAVITNNFTNYLYTLANDFCRSEDISFLLLTPLLQETVNRLTQYSPALMQTGPAVRNDQVTITRHLSLLQKHTELKRLYSILSDSIITHYSNIPQNSKID
jgi:predicted short-subunit dehydrogenase-like oxidoreductase (DUF2520 family)